MTVSFDLFCIGKKRNINIHGKVFFHTWVQIKVIIDIISGVISHLYAWSQARPIRFKEHSSRNGLGSGSHSVLVGNAPSLWKWGHSTGCGGQYRISFAICGSQRLFSLGCGATSHKLGQGEVFLIQIGKSKGGCQWCNQQNCYFIRLIWHGWWLRLPNIKLNFRNVIYCDWHSVLDY